MIQGTQSLNPHNDYCQHFVDTGHRPQNFIRDVGECVIVLVSCTFCAYCARVVLTRSAVQVWPTDLKSTRNFESSSGWRTNSSQGQTPLRCMLWCEMCVTVRDDTLGRSLRPFVCLRYLQADPEHFDLQDLKCKFDVILLEPPLEEYYRESGISHTERFWTWDDVSPVCFSSFWSTTWMNIIWIDSASVHTKAGHSQSVAFLLLQIMKLEIEEISALRSFVFLWCGSGEGLDLGRMVTWTPIPSRVCFVFCESCHTTVTPRMNHVIGISTSYSIRDTSNVCLLSCAPLLSPSGGQDRY